MNQLDVLRAIQYGWRAGGVASVESARRKLPKPFWLSRSLFGANFEVDASASLTQALLYVWGERLVVESKLISELVKPGMHAVDVGANVGYYLCLLQQCVGSKGMVTLIEPSVENIPALERNISMNGYANVRLHKVAVGEVAGRVAFRTGINGGVATDGADGYDVEVLALDALVDRRVDFLKVDVEGFEGQVLKGAKSVLVRDRPILFLELHPHIVGRFGHSMQSILKDLRAIYGADLEFYRDVSPDLSPVARVAARYRLLDPVQSVSDPEECADKLVKAKDESGTIWCVAGRRLQS